MSLSAVEQNILASVKFSAVTAFVVKSNTFGSLTIWIRSTKEFRVAFCSFKSLASTFFLIFSSMSSVRLLASSNWPLNFVIRVAENRKFCLLFLYFSSLFIIFHQTRLGYCERQNCKIIKFTYLLMSESFPFRRNVLFLSFDRLRRWLNISLWKDCSNIHFPFLMKL